MEAPELCLACWEWDEARYAEAIYILSTDCHPYHNLRDILALSTLLLFSLLSDIDSSNNAGSTMMILYYGDEWIVFTVFH